MRRARWRWGGNRLVGAPPGGSADGARAPFDAVEAMGLACAEVLVSEDDGRRKGGVVAASREAVAVDGSTGRGGGRGGERRGRQPGANEGEEECEAEEERGGSKDILRPLS